MTPRIGPHRPGGRYRSLFADRTFRRLMPVFALSDLGDGMTVVAVAWMALALGPEGGQGEQFLDEAVSRQMQDGFGTDEGEGRR